MARWDRDPRAKRRAVLALVIAEVVAVSVNFFFLFQVYFHWLTIRIEGSAEAMATTGLIVVYVATGVCVLACIAEAVLYVRGRGFARGLFIAENGTLILMGLAWFIVKQVGAEDPWALKIGLVLPVVTLFPLLWPLMVVRPDRPTPGRPAGR